MRVDESFGLCAIFLHERGEQKEETVVWRIIR